MDTQTLTLDLQHIDAAAIDKAAALLRSGELVAFPTETVYGLGADALNPTAVGRIFEVKGRPANDPIIVHIASADQLAEVAVDPPAVVVALAAKFWPGPLTVVLNRASKVAANVGGGRSTVGVRVPNHPIAQALIRAAGVPVAAPSANLFGHTSPTSAHHVLDDLNGKIPLILDGGPTPVGVESTVIDLSVDPPQLLRPGGVTLEAIETFLPNIVTVTHYALPDDGALSGPGMLEKHYAPRAELRLIEGTDGAIRRAILKLSNQLLDQGKKVGLLIATDDKNALPGLDNSIEIVTVGPLKDLDKVAKNLYEGMRKLDARSVDVILARSFPTDGIGAAIHDRLVRAARGQVIQAEQVLQ
ncbi:MAG TPA: L-threonylcarbamoyladenylate synthase [Aggregatilineales bacterium]|nr:L-threonylcarbamoyladenylate synthase [Aggregatilineales bacterium]